MIHSKDVFAAAQFEGVNVQVANQNGVLGVLYTRPDRFVVDVLATCDGTEVKRLEGVTDIGQLFVANE